MPESQSERIAEHTEFLRRIAVSVLGLGDQADDVVQDTMVVALRRGGDLEHRGWLAGILRNRAREARRAVRRRRHREGSAAVREAGTLEPAEMLALERMRATLFQAAVALPDEDREAVFMRFFDGHPPRRIAQILDVPVRSVHYRIERGLKSMRCSLNETYAARGEELRTYLRGVAYPLGARSLSVFGWGGLSLALGVVLVLAAVAVWGFGLVGEDRGSEADPLTASGVASPPGGEGEDSSRAVLDPRSPGFDSTARRTRPLLEGTVLDLNQRPVAHAQLDLTVRLPRGEAPGETRSYRAVADLQGKFKFAGVAAGTVEAFSASAQGHLTRHRVAEGHALSQETTRSVEITLPHEHILTGFVVDARGRPLAGVHLGARARGGFSEELGGPRYGRPTATSDQDGRFVLNKMLPGAGRLSAYRAGYYLAHEAGTASQLPYRLEPGVEADPVSVVMYAGVSVRGTVRYEGGEPVANTKVALKTIVPGHTFVAIDELVTETDREGRFRFENARPGRRMLFECRTETHGAGQEVVLVPHGGPEQVVEPVLRPFSSIRGRVDAQPGAVRLAKRPVKLLTPDWEFLEETRTDVNGEFEFTRVSSGRYLVQLPHSGGGRYATPKSPSIRVDVGWGEVVDDLLLVCPGLGDAGGRVTTPEGHPLGEFSLHLVSTEGPARNVRFSTDSDGTFAVHGLMSKAYDLVAGSTAFGRINVGDTSTEFVCPSGAISTDGRYTLRVLMPDGSPVASGRGIARVNVKQSPGKTILGKRVPFAVLDGIARIRLPGGASSSQWTWIVESVVDELGQPVNVLPAELTSIPTLENELTLKLKPGLSISGSVRDSEGRGVVGLRVFARGGRRHGSELRRPDRRRAVDTHTDSQGRFRLVGLDDAAWELRFGDRWDTWIDEPPKAVAAGTLGVEVVLREGMAISGVVVDERGKPVAVCPVSFSGRSSRAPDGAKVSAGGITDLKGRFSLAGLPAESVGTLYVRPPVMAKGLWLPSIIEDVSARRGDLELTLVEGVRIEGKVEFGAHEELQRVTVYLSGTDLPRSRRQSCTRDQPHFRFGPLSPGSYRLKVAPNGLVGEARVHEIEAPTSEIFLSLDDLELISGRLAVEDVSGFEVTFAWMDAKRPRLRRSQMVPIRDDGSFHVFAPPGVSGQLFALNAKKGLMVFLPEVSAAGGRLLITLAKGEEIRGRVEGGPAGDYTGSVWILGAPAGYPVKAPVAADGSFRLRALPSGTYELFYRHAKNRYRSNPVTIEAGSTDVVLRAEGLR